MARFPVIYVEEAAQALDKTRIDASASYVSAGSGAITKAEARPNRNAAWTDITNDDPASMVLDWGHAFEFECTTGRNKLAWIDSLGVTRTITLASAQLTPTALAAALQVALNAAGSPDTFAVSWSASTRKFTFTANGEVQLLPGNADSVLPEMGFSGTQVIGLSTVGAAVKYFTATAAIQLTTGVAPDEASDLKEAATRVIPEDADRLFSTDAKLRSHESDILKYLPEGRATFKDVHRRAQTLILAWLDTEGFIDNTGHKFTLDSLTDIEEVAEWATMMALRLIFESVRNATDDVFSEKAEKYQKLEDFYRDRASLKIDLDGDGVAEAVTERLDIRTCIVVRR